MSVLSLNPFRQLGILQWRVGDRKQNSQELWVELSKCQVFGPREQEKSPRIPTGKQFSHAGKLSFYFYTVLWMKNSGALKSFCSPGTGAEVLSDCSLLLVASSTDVFCGQWLLEFGSQSRAWAGKEQSLEVGGWGKGPRRRKVGGLEMWKESQRLDG